MLSLFPNNFYLIYYLSFQTVPKDTSVLIIPLYIKREVTLVNSSDMSLIGEVSKKLL